MTDIMNFEAPAPVAPAKVAADKPGSEARVQALLLRGITIKTADKAFAWREAFAAEVGKPWSPEAVEKLVKSTMAKAATLKLSVEKTKTARTFLVKSSRLLLLGSATLREINSKAKTLAEQNKSERSGHKGTYADRMDKIMLEGNGKIDVRTAAAMALVAAKPINYVERTKVEMLRVSANGASWAKTTKDVPTINAKMRLDLAAAVKTIGAYAALLPGAVKK